MGCALLGPGLAEARPIDGVWVTDLSSVRWMGRPETLTVSATQFFHLSDRGGLTTLVDGAPHPLASGQGPGDSISAKVIGPGVVETTVYRGGRPVARTRWTLSPDAQTLTESRYRLLPKGGEDLNFSVTFSRDGPAPPGDLPLSGTWRRQKLDRTESGFQLNRFRDLGDRLEWSNGAGMTYDAPFNGALAAQTNDPGHTQVSVRRLDDRHYVETDWRGGRKSDVFTMVISPDDVTLTTTDQDLLTGEVIVQTAHKQ